MLRIKEDLTMALKFLQVRDLPAIWIDLEDREHPPSPEEVDAMAAALEKDGHQLQPVLVRGVTGESFKVIVGATRVLAIQRLSQKGNEKWAKIRCNVVTGLPIDFKIAELSENVSRRVFKGDERRKMLSKLKQLYAERGEPISNRQLAKQTGVSHATVNRSLGSLGGTNVPLRRPVAGAQSVVPPKELTGWAKGKADEAEQRGIAASLPGGEMPDSLPELDRRAKKVPPRPEECIMRWLEYHVLLFQFLQEHLQTDSSYHAEVNELAAYCFKERGEEVPPAAEEIREVAKWLEAFAAALEEYEIRKAAS
jgi:ParB-like nuclease domain